MHGAISVLLEPLVGQHIQVMAKPMILAQTCSPPAAAQINTSGFGGGLPCLCVLIQLLGATKASLE